MKKKIIIISIALCLAGASSVLGLNGYFGGGSDIPEDTMTRGLVASYNFDEGFGTTAYDASDNSNDGTLTNGPKWTEGKFGKGMEFDGTDDYINAGNDSSLDITDAITIEAWVEATDILGPPQTILSKANYALKEYDDEYIFQILGALGSWSDTATLGGTSPVGLAVYDGKLYATCYGDHTVRVWDGSSWSNTATLGGTNPRGLAVYDGKLYAACSGGHTVRVWDGSSWSDTATLGGTSPLGLAVYDGKLYATCYGDNTVRVWDGSSWSNTATLGGTSPVGLAVYDGKLYATCYGDSTVHVWDGSSWSDTATLGGTSPLGLAVYDGKLYAACSGGHTVRVWDGSSWSDTATLGGTSPLGLAVYDGKLYATCNGDHTVRVWDGSSWSDTATLGGTSPRGLAVYDGKLYAACYGDSTVRVIGTGESIRTDKGTGWQHIVGVFSATLSELYLKLYVNGVLASETTHSLTISNNALSLYIGKGYGSSQSGLYGGNASNFNGSIDGVKIYNRALSAEEVRYHYNRGGPVAHWKFDEGTGTTAYDSTDNNNDGTLTNMDDSDWVQGRYGTALDLDGTDDVVSATQTSAINLTSKKGYTISSWVYPHSDGEADAGEIIDKGADTFLRVDNEADSLLDVEAKLDLTTTDATLNITDAISINVWSHIVLAYEDDDDDEITIYVNGINKGTSTDGDGAPATDSNNLLIGGDSAANFDGLIDDVRIYAYARSADEIRLDYNAGFAARFGSLTSGDCSTDPAACMDYGLVASYNMDEGAGDILYDQSDSGNDGTLENGPKWTNSSLPNLGGVGGGSLQFDGVNDYVNCGSDSSLDITDAITIEAWVKSDSLPVETSILSKGCTGSCSNYDFYIKSGKLALLSNNSCDWAYAGDNSIVSTGVWQYIVAIYDGTNVNYYINGVLKDSKAWGGIGSTNSDSLEIGKQQASLSGWFDGSIDGVKIYNRALSAEEVRYHYNRGGPVAHWKFDEGSGTTAHDIIGNADAQFPSNEANQPTWSRP